MDTMPNPVRGKKTWTWRILTILCTAVLVVSAVQLTTTLWRSKKEDDIFKELAEYTEGGAAPRRAEKETRDRSGGSREVKEEELQTDPRREHYRTLKEMNPDFAGWLAIAGTKVDYPVMHTPDDQQYYIHRDFYGKESVSGTPFMGDRCDPDSQSIIIYGHNMKNGSMFGSLDQYEREEYWQEHPVMEFRTVKEDREYDIAAVFRTRIYRDDEEGFRYYQYVGDLTEEQFEEFRTQTAAQALYDTGISLEPEDELLILSTCAYHVRDGRFVVVGRRRR